MEGLRSSIRYVIPAIRDAVIKTILQIHLRDSVKMRLMNKDGSYKRVEPGAEPIDSQAWMIQHRGIWHGN
jgi:hypothetical protein